MALAVITTTRVAQEAARGDRAALRERTAEGARAVWMMASASAVGLIVLAEPIVTVLFERGRFGPGETAATAPRERGRRAPAGPPCCREVGVGSRQRPDTARDEHTSRTSCWGWDANRRFPWRARWPPIARAASAQSRAGQPHPARSATPRRVWPGPRQGTDKPSRRAGARLYAVGSPTSPRTGRTSGGRAPRRRLRFGTRRGSEAGRNLRPG